MIADLKWLWAVWRLRRAYMSKGMMFSHRIALLRLARPPLKHNVYIDWPDAFFHLSPLNVAAALMAIKTLSPESILSIASRETS